MRISVDRTDVEQVEDLRAAQRFETNCQIVRHSMLPRGLADAYVFRVGDESVGYGGVWNEHFPGRVMEFYVFQDFREHATAFFEELLLSSGATQIEAQTNMPQLYDVLGRFVEVAVEEHILFVDGRNTTLTSPTEELRERRVGDEGPEGAWVVEGEGVVLAAGGVLDHYNPPYGDVYMEVSKRARRRGIGSYLVQELRRVCKQNGMIPAARCDPGSEASNRTLLRGGFVECGRLVAGRVKPELLRGRSRGDIRKIS